MIFSEKIRTETRRNRAAVKSGRSENLEFEFLVIMPFPNQNISANYRAGDDMVNGFFRTNETCGTCLNSGFMSSGNRLLAGTGNYNRFNTLSCGVIFGHHKLSMWTIEIKPRHQFNQPIGNGQGK